MKGKSPDWRKPGRVLLYTGGILAGLFVLCVLALQFYLLPHANDFRQQIAASISHAAGQEVSIGGIDAGWDHLHPRLSLQNVRVFDRAHRPVLFFRRVETSISWVSLWVGEVRLQTLEIAGPHLTAGRDAAGRFSIAGFQINPSAPGGGDSMGDWLFRQHHIRIRDAAITWQDGLRRAPPVTLAHCDLSLDNLAGLHHVRISAVPPAQIGQPLRIDGYVFGRTLNDIDAWRGFVRLRSNQLHLAALRPWVDYPFELDQGDASLDLRLDISGKRILRARSNIQLSQLVARARPEQPLLQVKSFTGTVDWRQGHDGYDLSLQKLQWVAGRSVTAAPADIHIHYQDSLFGHAQGQVRARVFKLETITALEPYLPLSATMRSQLRQLAPSGNLHDLVATWARGRDNRLHLSLSTRFDAVSFTAAGRLPGASNLAGALQMDDAGGKLNLATRSAGVQWTPLFPTPWHFDQLAGSVTWQIRQNQLHVQMNQVVASNSAAEGTLQARYDAPLGQPGELDLTAHLGRADAQYLSTYLPRVIPAPAVDWMKHNIRGGISDGVDFRVKGNVGRFPYTNASKQDLFMVHAHVMNGELTFGPGWPGAGHVDLDLLINNGRMAINARKGTIMGAQLADVSVVLPDFFHDATLQVHGFASGPTSEMLRFVKQSPVDAMIDHVTRNIAARGNGRLELGLTLPLLHLKDVRVNGKYAFANNTLLATAQWPQVQRINGILSFSESGVQARGLTGYGLGGPVHVSVNSAGGRTQMFIKGRATAASLSRFLAQPVLHHAAGASDYTARFNWYKNTSAFSIDSNLVGLAVNLPYPLNKPAATAVPLHVAQQSSDDTHEVWSAAYNNLVYARGSRGLQKGRMQFLGGEVSFGAAPAAAGANGLSLSGHLPMLDIDAWRSALKGEEDPSGALPFNGVNLAVQHLTLMGRQFNQMAVAAAPVPDGWRLKVQGRELDGVIDYLPQGAGTIRAKLNHLSIPDHLPAAADPPPLDSSRLPVLDIAANSFTSNNLNLGRLHLLTRQDHGTWFIDELTLTNPDSYLKMKGQWRDVPQHEQTQMSLILDVYDIGKLLGRLDHPHSVRAGTATLRGNLSWAGSVNDINWPTLTGTLDLDAHKGQFLKIDPGLGKLLGILSLQALPRHIALDFRDVFSQGFAFDTIAGHVNINHGVASSNNFAMAGPAARVSMQGNTDLARETQDLHVLIVPQLGDSVSVASAFLGGPVVGITSYVLQKLLKNPIDQMAAYQYYINGTWASPQVRKVHTISRSR